MARKENFILWLLKKVKNKYFYLSTVIIDKLFPFVYIAHGKKIANNIVTEIAKTSFIVSPIQTLEIIAEMLQSEKPGAYMRFGDGDIFLLTGKNDMLQNVDNNLASEMKEAFSLKGEGLIKTLSIHSDIYGKEKEMFVGNFVQTEKIAHELMLPIFQWFVGYKIFSPVALHYIASYYPEKANEFLRLLKTKACLFIGNTDVPAEVIYKLFGEVQHIKTPSRNAFIAIDEVEQIALEKLQNQNNFGVVVIAMGCSGRILMKRLYKSNNNLFYFDFGSLLDGICNNISRVWLEKVQIDYSILLKGL